MAKNSNKSKEEMKKLNKVYKKARDAVRYCDPSRIVIESFCSEDSIYYPELVAAVEKKSLSDITAVLVQLNQEKRKQMLDGDISEKEYVKWCDEIRMMNK